MAQDPTKCLARCRETVKIFWCPARRVGNSLIAHLLRSNERLWASRSDRSGQMSYCERFAKVAHDKWANRSFVEQIACLLSESLIRSFAHKTGAIRSKNVEENNFFCTFFVSFFLNQWFAHFLFFNERCEWIARFLNESLFRSLFANFFAKIEWFAQKTDEVIPYPAWAKLKKQHFKVKFWIGDIQFNKLAQYDKCPFFLSKITPPYRMIWYRIDLNKCTYKSVRRVAENRAR